jgi:hypothetical protein
MEKSTTGTEVDPNAALLIPDVEAEDCLVMGKERVSIAGYA